MDVRTLTVASVAGLALAGTASADFTGLAASSFTGMTSGGTALDVFGLYATFDSAADQAVAIGGTPLFPQTLNSGGSGFFNVTVFGSHLNSAATAGQLSFIPDLAFDSFLSVGVQQGFGTTMNAPTIQFFNGGDFNGAGTGFGQPTVTTMNGGWFLTPGDAETFAIVNAGVIPPGGGFSVFLGQFAVAQGNTFSGDLGQLSIFESGVNRIIDNSNGSTFSFTRPLVPAPGALAVLGLAGVVGRRRRRA